MAADSEFTGGTSTSRHGEQLPAAVIITDDGHHLIPQNGFPEISGLNLHYETFWLVHEHSLAVKEKCVPGLGGVYRTPEGARSEAERCCDIRALIGVGA